MKLLTHKTVLPAVLLMLLGMTAAAQPTFTSQYFQAVGDTEIYVPYSIDAMAAQLPGASGANQTWTFSFAAADTAGPIVTNAYISPAATAYASSFPNANLVVATHNSVDTAVYDYTYLMADASEYTFWGSATPAAELLVYSDPRVFSLPLAFGTSQTDAFAATGTSDSAVINITGSVMYMYDAYGVLTLNDSVYNTVRLYTTDSMVYDFGFGFTSLFVSQIYTWFNTDNSEPVLSVVYTSSEILGNATTTAQARIYIHEPNTAAVGCDLVVGLSTTNPSCSASDGSIDAILTGGTAPFAFAWSNGATTEDVTGLPSDTYDVTITDAEMCTAVGSVTLVDPTAFILGTVIMDATCGLANGFLDITVDGGTEPYAFSWSNGATTEDISNLTAGVYDLTITDANNCTATLTETIGDSPAPTLTTTVTNANSGQSDGEIDVTVWGGTGPFVYAWSHGETTEDVTGVMAGMYTVTVTDANGCTATTNATVVDSSSSAPLLTATVTDAGCGNANGAIDLIVTGGTNPYTFNWANGATTEDISGLASGAYSVTVTDASGATAEITQTITDAPAPTITTIAIDASCGVNNGSVDVTLNGGTAPFTFAWSNGATTEDLTGLAAGTFDVTVTDANGCTATATSTITASGTCGTPAFVNSQVTGTSATISWTSQPCAVKYRLRVKKIGSGGGPWMTYFINAPDTTFLISGLVPGGIYKYRLRAQCSPGGAVLSAWSAAAYFTANGGVDSCAAPSDAAFANVTATSADITWTPVTGAYGYRVRYRAVGTASWTTVVSNNGNSGSISLTDLQATTTYEFQVRTKCSIGPNVFSAFSPIGTFTTPVMRVGENEPATVLLYPNPASGFVTLASKLRLESASLVVYNALGQAVLTMENVNT
ncbi:MAG TPA: fibronectin type III domain-containing protein, partial [Chitinophagales bacterium]|nr:fibronectin type III domain-containing protein [Chitinophagales bacterium]